MLVGGSSSHCGLLVQTSDQSNSIAFRASEDGLSQVPEMQQQFDVSEQEHAAHATHKRSRNAENSRISQKPVY